MEVRVTPETRAALQEDFTIRCVLKTKFKLKQRHSQPVIAWATDLVKEISRDLLKESDQEYGDDQYEVLLNIVTLFHPEPRALILFDLFSKQCSSETRSQVEQSVRRPIHSISRRGGVYFVRRDSKLDDIVADEFQFELRHDKCPRPYFSDYKNPPLYINGIRQEEPLDGNQEEQADESDGSNGLPTEGHNIEGEKMNEDPTE